MAVGFVLISVVPAHEHEVYNKLSKVSEIVELHPLFGEFDIIAKIEADDFESLGNIVVNKISRRFELAIFYYDTGWCFSTACLFNLYK